MQAKTHKVLCAPCLREHVIRVSWARRGQSVRVCFVDLPQFTTRSLAAVHAVSDCPAARLAARLLGRYPWITTGVQAWDAAFSQTQGAIATFLAQRGQHRRPSVLPKHFDPTTRWNNLVRDHIQRKIPQLQVVSMDDEGDTWIKLYAKDYDPRTSERPIFARRICARDLVPLLRCGLLAGTNDTGVWFAAEYPDRSRSTVYGYIVGPAAHYKFEAEFNVVERKLHMHRREPIWVSPS